MRPKVTFHSKVFSYLNHGHFVDGEYCEQGQIFLNCIQNYHVIQPYFYGGGGGVSQFLRVFFAFSYLFQVLVPFFFLPFVPFFFLSFPNLQLGGGGGLYVPPPFFIYFFIQNLSPRPNPQTDLEFPNFGYIIPRKKKSEYLVDKKFYLLNS